MKLKHDLHTHTTFSHGKDRIEDMVRAARTQGIKEITISDHGRNHPFFGIDPKNLTVMREEIDFINNNYDDIKVNLGIEANIIGSDGAVDIFDEELEFCDSFYAGYHYGYLPDTFKNFYSFWIPNVAAQFIPPIKDLRRGYNTEAYLKMIERYPFLTMITHPGDKMPIDIAPVAELAAKNNIILELNQHHERLSVDDLITASQYPVKFAVGSDAHRKEDVGKTGRAEEMIIRSGVDPERFINIDFTGREA